MFRRSFFARLLSPIAALFPAAALATPQEVAEADKPVTRAELAAILNESGIMVMNMEGPDTFWPSFNDDHPCPAYLRLLEQVGEVPAKSESTTSP